MPVWYHKAHMEVTGLPSLLRHSPGSVLFQLVRGICFTSDAFTLLSCCYCCCPSLLLSSADIGGITAGFGLGSVTRRFTRSGIVNTGILNDTAVLRV